MASLHELTYTHPLLLKAIDNLLVHQIVKEYREVNGLKLNNEEIRKVGWLASMLADSENEDHKSRAQTIAVLLYLNNIENIEVAKLCYVILSRTGNLLATKFITNVLSTKGEGDDNVFFSQEFDILLDFELGFKRLLNLITIANENIPATDFQIHLWNSLNTKNNLSISAPTSGGKSFIIQSYIRKCFLEFESFSVIYIVPTKALITQVTQTFDSILSKDVKVLSGFSEDSNSIETLSKVIYVVTPERCMRLLQQGWKNLFSPDFVFIDEIQNVERTDSRGLLLEYIVNEISTLWSLARITVAGPMIKKLNELLFEVSERNSLLVETQISPVFQIKVSVKTTEKNKVKLSIYTSPNRFTDVVLPLEINLVKAFSDSHGKALSEIAILLGTGSQNIIYAPRTDYAEFWCKKLVETLQEKGVGESNQQNNAVRELIQFISEEIHPLYYLKDFLKYGVAFHHGKLPEVVRDEVEHLYIHKHLHFLVCTSTLLEGVNLPASKIFIIHANKDQKPLSKFDFGNLIGRAGRIKSSLYGTVYGIEKPLKDNAKEWTNEYFTSSSDKELMTAAKKTLSEKLNVVVTESSKSAVEIEEIDTSSTLTFLRLKALKSKESLLGYLENKKILDNQSNVIADSVLSSVANITLSYEILRLNPSIDPVLQEALYKRILREGVEDWAVVRNSVKYMSNDDVSKVPLHDRSLFQQLVYVFIKLDEIFRLEKETYDRFKISMRIGQMVYYGYQWMQGITLGVLIKKDIKFYATHSNTAKRIDDKDQKKVNERINSVIKIQTSVVSFILVKYMKVCNDILESIMTDDQKKLYSFSLSLPTKLEFGTLDGIVITLISNGIPRSLALKLANLIPTSAQDSPLSWIKSQKALPINEVYLKHLRRRNLIGY